MYICMIFISTFIITKISSIVAPIINSKVVLYQIQDEGGNASFTCQTTGEPVPTISWYFNGTLLAGATHTIT